MPDKSFLEKAAAELGADISPDFTPVRFEPPVLSSTTRRHTRAADLHAESVRRFSLPAQLERSADAADLEIWDRQLDAAARALDLQETMKTQMETGEVAELLGTLDPSAADWEDKLAAISVARPRGISDPRIQRVVENQRRAHLTARENAETLRLRTEAVEDRQRIALEESQRNDRELREGIGLRVAELSPVGQTAYRTAIENGETPLSAFQSARTVDREVSNAASLAAAGVPAEDSANIAKSDVQTAARIYQAKASGMTSQQLASIKAAARMAEREVRDYQEALSDPLAPTERKAEVQQRLEQTRRELDEYREVLRTGGGIQPESSTGDGAEPQRKTPRAISAKDLMTRALEGAK